MKIVVDAQLPYGLKLFLKDNGYDGIHTDDMPNMERTSDTEIINISKLEDRIIITKDKDFLDIYLLFNKPKKLILITSGNIKNKEFFLLFRNNFKTIIELLSKHSLIELNSFEITGK
jgi:predicted nuclease of predicted toxin-antitoxin system